MPSTPSSRSPLLEMRSISKTFPGVRALHKVNLDLHSGEIHALVGENGAGKSTLIKILAGIYCEYRGEIRICGELQQFRSAHDSAQASVAIVHQELSLVPELTVGENVFLGREPSRFGVVQWNELYLQAGNLLRELGVDIDPRMATARLGTAQQQLIEIAKALSQKARILVLDEPTAALTDAESASLFSILKNLCGQGMGIIYISHRLDEVFHLSDRITVLRDGEIVGTKPTLQLSQANVIMRMVGREVSKTYPTAGRKPGKTILEVRELCAEDADGNPVLRDVNFSLRSGEVLGIAGLMGAGRTELLMAIFGAWTGKVSGQILMAGQRTTFKRPQHAIANGIGLATEDRKRSGLVLDQTILSNVTLVALKELSGRFITNELQEIAVTNPLLDKLRIKAASPLAIVNTLSGGTQQKVVLAKWLLNDPRVLLLDEPTRGIDIAAKHEIYEIINELAKSGLAIVMVSSELPEVLGLCDRILVMHEGQLAGEFAREEATPEAVMACATGQTARA